MVLVLESEVVEDHVVVVDEAVAVEVAVEVVLVVVAAEEDVVEISFTYFFLSHLIFL